MTQWRIKFVAYFFFSAHEIHEYRYKQVNNPKTVQASCNIKTTSLSYLSFIDNTQLMIVSMPTSSI